MQVFTIPEINDYVKEYNQTKRYKNVSETRIWSENIEPICEINRYHWCQVKVLKLLDIFQIPVKGGARLLRPPPLGYVIGLIGLG